MRWFTVPLFLFISIFLKEGESVFQPTYEKEIIKIIGCYYCYGFSISVNYVETMMKL